MTNLLENAPPIQKDWKQHLSEAGYEEWMQLISLLKDAPEFFALFIVQSDFDTETRDALLEELGEELAPVPAIEIELTSNNYDLPFLLHQANQVQQGAKFFSVVGLEETPGLVLADGEQPRRPPALAILNHGREAIRNVEHPVVLWCDPTAYAALREHAPDFFDHYTALFTFLDAAPGEFAPLNSLFDLTLMPNGGPRMLSAISPPPRSPETKHFYEEQVARFTHPTVDRVRALLGLADSLFGLSDAQSLRYEKRIETILREALELSHNLALHFEKARTQAMLSILLKRETRKDGLNIPERNQEMLRLIEQSLEIYTENEFPVQWAASQWCLGTELAQISGDDESKRRAVYHLKEAGRVWRQQKQPYYWASVEMNIGYIYLSLPTTKGNLKRAIFHLEEALKGYTEKAWPREYAVVQVSLGKAHSTMAQQEQKDKNASGRWMRKAIASYQAATRGFARVKDDELTALALASEGLVWRGFPIGNRKEHLRRGAECFFKSANLSAQVEDKLHSAMYFQTAGEIYFELLKLTRSTRELEQSLTCHELARQAFEECGDKDGAKRNAEIAQDYHKSLERVLSKNHKN